MPMVCEPLYAVEVPSATPMATPMPTMGDVAIRTPATTFAPHARTWGHIRIRFDPPVAVSSPSQA